MSALQRITTEYVGVEDRIRLSGKDGADDAAPVVIWITQRLLQRLLPVLLEWLERREGASLRADVVRSFAQQAARAELVPQEPVRAAADSAAWLAREVDIGRDERSVRLSWRGGEGQSAFFELSAKPLRQWLGILHDHCVKADWPLDAWPEWVCAAAPARAERTGLLH